MASSINVTLKKKAVLHSKLICQLWEMLQRVGRSIQSGQYLKDLCTLDPKRVKILKWKHQCVITPLHIISDKLAMEKISYVLISGSDRSEKLPVAENEILGQDAE